MQRIDTPIDWHYWWHMQEVEFWQACLLSLNINPDTMKVERNSWMGGPQDAPYFEEGSFPSNQARDDYRKRLNLLKSNKYRPEYFSAGKINMGAPNRCGVQLPEFAAWAMRIEIPIPPELVAIAHSPKTPKSEITTMEEKSLSTTERNTLFKLIIGMAIKGYSHDPTALKSSTPKEIADDLATLGIDISDDTVRKYLKQAANGVLPVRGCSE